MGLNIFTVSLLAVVSLAIWPIINHSLLMPQPVQRPEIAVILPENGWSLAGKSALNWTPTLVNPSKVRVQTFEKSGRHVDVFIGIYSGQSWTSKLVTSVNQFVGESTIWSLVDRGAALTQFSGKLLDVKSGVILGRENRIVAWQWYWIDGAVTANDMSAKRLQLRARLNGSNDASAWVAIYTGGEASPQDASKTLNDFMQEMSGALEQALRRSTQVLQ